MDIKHGGITIVGNLARAHAIRAGLTAKRTIDRLRASEHAGAIDAETREGLEEAFRFLWEVRLRHHVEQIAAGEPPDDFVDPKELGGVARQGLKEAFRIIARAQKGLARGGRRRAPLAGLARVARGSGRRRPDRVVAAVDVHHLAGDPARQVRQQEHDRVGDRRRVGRVPPERRPVAPPVGERLEPGDALAGDRAQRARADSVFTRIPCGPRSRAR